MFGVVTSTCTLAHFLNKTRDERVTLNSLYSRRKRRSAVCSTSVNKMHLQRVLRGILFVSSMVFEIRCQSDWQGTKEKRSSPVCQTRECQILSGVVLSAMNRSVNPCDDFWEHACGNWISRTPIPPSAAIWNRFSLLTLKMNEHLREILESDIESTDLGMLKKAKGWYKSCMDRSEIERNGIKNLFGIVEQIGGWPLTMKYEEWLSKNIPWQKIDLFYARLTGSYSLFSVKVGKNYANPLLYKILVTRVELPLSIKLPAFRKKFDEEDRKAYGKLITNVAEKFIRSKSSKINKSQLRKDVNDMLNFEAQLSKIDLGKLYQLSQIRVISANYDNVFGRYPSSRVNFTEIIQGIFEAADVKIPPTEIINIHYDYIFELGNLLRRTSIRTIANYVHWTFISDFIDATDLEMENYLLEFKKTTFGVKEQRPRWEYCVRTHGMRHAIAVEFVKKYFPDNAKNLVSKMITSIRRAMEQEIQESNWMTSTTKVLAIRKLKKIITLVGYPDWYHNATVLQQAYQGLNISGNYFDNVINFHRFALKAMGKVLKTVDKRDSWLSDPITVNAFYRIFVNNINLPAGAFQPPFFTQDVPEIVNYAMLGSITGHEFSHAFDSIGIKFDENGRYRSLAPSVLNAYLKNAKCFIGQYAKYYKTGGNEIANLTLNENIADNQGTRVAFAAYESLPHQERLVLPGFEGYTSEQTFFIMFSSLWCSKATPQYDRKRLMDDEENHSDPRLRVLGTLSNFEDFAKAFNCPVGSPMNPAVKCNVWKTEEKSSRP